MLGFCNESDVFWGRERVDFEEAVRQSRGSGNEAGMAEDDEMREVLELSRREEERRTGREREALRFVRLFNVRPVC